MVKYIKKDIIKNTAEIVDMDVRDVAPIVNAVFECLGKCMISDRGESRIEIRNFGVFEVKRTAAKPKARNPKKPEQIIYVPPRRKAIFRPGAALKRELHLPLEDN